MIGALLAFMSAFTFALNNTALRRGVITAGVFQALIISVPLGLPIFIVAGAVTGAYHRVPDLTPFQWACFSAAGLIHFVFGRYCNYRSVQALGANLSSTILQVNLPMSLTLAVVVLGEHMTIPKLLGTLLVISGPALVLHGRRKVLAARQAPADPTKPPKFIPNYRIGFIFGLMTALGYGVSPILVRAGVQDMGVGGDDGVLAGAVAYTIATLAVLAIVALSARARANVRAVNREALPWFAVSGALVGVSQFLIYLALSFAPVTIVIPIAQTSSIIRVFTGWAVNRDYEIFDFRVLIAICLSFLGALVLALNVDFVADLLNLSPAIRAALQWTWP